jgi:hypothetical protein
MDLWYQAFGADFAIFVKSLNDDPENCFTEEGVTHTIINFTTVTFQKGPGKRLVCFGRSDSFYSPGPQSQPVRRVN